MSVTGIKDIRYAAEKALEYFLTIDISENPVILHDSSSYAIMVVRFVSSINDEETVYFPYEDPKETP